MAKSKMQVIHSNMTEADIGALMVHATDVFAKTDPTQTPDPRWLAGIHFMSGATIAVQAASAHATIAA